MCSEWPEIVSPEISSSRSMPFSQWTVIISVENFWSNVFIFPHLVLSYLVEALAIVENFKHLVPFLLQRKTPFLRLSTSHKSFQFNLSLMPLSKISNVIANTGGLRTGHWEPWIQCHTDVRHQKKFTSYTIFIQPEQMLKRQKSYGKCHLIVQLYVIHSKVMKKGNWPSGIHRSKFNFRSKHSEFKGNFSFSCTTSIPKNLQDPCPNLLAKYFWKHDAASIAPYPYPSNHWTPECIQNALNFDVSQRKRAMAKIKVCKASFVIL